MLMAFLGSLALGATPQLRAAAGTVPHPEDGPGREKLVARSAALLSSSDSPGCRTDPSRVLLEPC